MAFVSNQHRPLFVRRIRSTRYQNHLEARNCLCALGANKRGRRITRCCSEFVEASNFFSLSSLFSSIFSIRIFVPDSRTNFVLFNRRTIIS